MSRIPQSPRELLRQFQLAFARHGNGDFLVVAIPYRDNRANLPAGLLDVRHLHFAGSDAVPCALALVGTSPRAGDGVDTFVALAKAAGAIALAGPAEIGPAEGPEGVWLSYLFACLRETTDYVAQREGYALLSNTFAASLEGCKHLIDGSKVRYGPAEGSNIPGVATLKLELLSDGFIYRGYRHALTGKPLAMLRALADSRWRALSAEALQDGIWPDYNVAPTTIRSVAKSLRRALRQATGRGRQTDPLPCTGRGRDLGWKLDLP